MRRRAVECFRGYSIGDGCDANKKPIENERCNEQGCPAWRKGGWTPVR